MIIKNRLLTKPKILIQTIFVISFLSFLTIPALPSDKGEIPGYGISGKSCASGNIVIFTEPGKPQNVHSIDIKIPVKKFIAVIIDKENIKWFLTESGLVSFDGINWKLHNSNNSTIPSGFRGIAFENDSDGQEIWAASENGVTVLPLPVDAQPGTIILNEPNAKILSNNVFQVATGKNQLRWFGTDKGVSALKGDKWLTPDYEEFYPEFIFQEFPILSMATNFSGDSLFVGTSGAGVVRLYSNEVDGISGASVLAQWGPMILPSDKIFSIHVSKDGSRWFGTDLGVAKHSGSNSLENWTAYTTDDGLIDNFVQAIASDREGKIWFGTKGGISVFDGNEWKSYTQKEGLSNNNVLCIAVDQKGIIWIGTDDGVTAFDNGIFTIYK